MPRRPVIENAKVAPVFRSYPRSIAATILALHRLTRGRRGTRGVGKCAGPSVGQPSYLTVAPGGAIRIDRVSLAEHYAMFFHCRTRWSGPSRPLPERSVRAAGHLFGRPGLRSAPGGARPRPHLSPPGAPGLARPATPRSPQDRVAGTGFASGRCSRPPAARKGPSGEPLRRVAPDWPSAVSFQSSLKPFTPALGRCARRCRRGSARPQSSRGTRALSADELLGGLLLRGREPLPSLPPEAAPDREGRAGRLTTPSEWRGP
jgi:hypothetical protein